MHAVFVYETLKRKKILEKALGESHGKKYTPTMVEGAHELNIDGYPTLKFHTSDIVKGDLIHVSDEELKDLDDWESKYRRMRVVTNKGVAWTYVLKG